MLELMHDDGDNLFKTLNRQMNRDSEIYATGHPCSCKEPGFLVPSNVINLML